MKNMLFPCLLLLLTAPVLSAQETIDRKAATMDIVMAYTEDFENIEDVKKYFGPDHISIWSSGTKANLKMVLDGYDFWRNRTKNEFSEVEIRELDDEIYFFCSWKSTMKKNEEDTKAVGTTAVVPLAYRFIWEKGKVKEWHVFVDWRSFDQQHGITN